MNIHIDIKPLPSPPLCPPYCRDCETISDKNLKRSRIISGSFKKCIKKIEFFFAYFIAQLIIIIIILDKINHSHKTKREFHS